jgi:hypothetical protein
MLPRFPGPLRGCGAIHIDFDCEAVLDGEIVILFVR